MSTLLFIPAFLLGFPMIIGVWLAGLKVYKFIREHSSSQTAFVTALCIIAACLSLLTAPIWLLGWQGYAVVCAVYVAFVAVGAPHVFRTFRFLSLELDGNPEDQVPLPGDDSAKKK